MPSVPRALAHWACSLLAASRTYGDYDEEKNKSSNCTDITQTKNMWRSYYDRDDTENVLMIFKVHEPKSTEGYSRYSVS